MPQRAPYGTISKLYSPECVEGVICEVRVLWILLGSCATLLQTDPLEGDGAWTRSASLSRAKARRRLSAEPPNRPQSGATHATSLDGPSSKNASTASTTLSNRGERNRSKECCAPG